MALSMVGAGSFRKRRGRLISGNGREIEFEDGDMCR